MEPHGQEQWGLGEEGGGKGGRAESAGEVTAQRDYLLRERSSRERKGLQYIHVSLPELSFYSCYFVLL